MGLTPEQVEIVVRHRDAGDRQIVAARAAGTTAWQVSQWCAAQGTPWPRRLRHSSGATTDRPGQAPVTRAAALAGAEGVFIKASKSSDPKLAEAGRRWLAEHRERLEAMKADTNPMSLEKPETTATLESADAGRTAREEVHQQREPHGTPATGDRSPAREPRP